MNAEKLQTFRMRKCGKQCSGPSRQQRTSKTENRAGGPGFLLSARACKSINSIRRDLAGESLDKELGRRRARRSGIREGALIGRVAKASPSACQTSVPRSEGEGVEMSEKFETRGEIGHALAGLRDQLAVQAKVFAVAAGLSVVALGFLYNQYSATTLKFADVLASNAQIEAQDERHGCSHGQDGRRDEAGPRRKRGDQGVTVETALEPHGRPATHRSRDGSASMPKARKKPRRLSTSTNRRCGSTPPQPTE